MRKLLFIYNPRSGKGTIGNHIADIIDLFIKQKFRVEVYPSQAQGDAMRMAMEHASEFERVVVSGGDGTFDEVVTGMIKGNAASVPIGYIPSGSTNDFARSLALPMKTIKAAQVAAGEHFFCSDIGAFNEDTFVYVAAFGVFTEVTYTTNQKFKNILGHAAYLIEGMNHLQLEKFYHLTVKSKECSIEDDFILGMVTNSRTVGGFSNLPGRYVELDDGEFEVTLVKRPQNVIELNQILSALVMEETDLCGKIVSFRTASITVESEEEIPWNFDGENGGKHKKAVISCRHREITILVP